MIVPIIGFGGKTEGVISREDRPPSLYGAAAFFCLRSVHLYVYMNKASASFFFFFGSLGVVAIGFAK